MLIRPLLFRREREKNKVNGSLSRVPSLSLSAKKKNDKTHRFPAAGVSELARVEGPSCHCCFCWGWGGGLVRGVVTSAVQTEKKRKAAAAVAKDGMEKKR